MPTIFRKTAKGVAEIDTRTRRLSPRMRSLLILVDGKRDSEDLAQWVPPHAEASLLALQSQGFIEAVGETVGVAAAPSVAVVAVAEPTPPAYAVNAATASADPLPSDRRSLRKAAADLAALRKAAGRALAEQLGPSADPLVARMARAKTLSELRPLLNQAAQLVLAARGRATAAAYAERFPSK